VIPCLSRMTSKARGTDQNRPATKSPAQRSISASAAGHGVGRLNLSRWRHGFEPRWDYERKTPGQGTSPESIGSLNRDSDAGYPANIPHRIERSECAKGCAPRGWMHSPSRPLGTRHGYPTPGRRGGPSHRSAPCELSIGIDVAARSPTGRRTRAPGVRDLIMAERGLGVACLSPLRNGAKPVLGKDLVR
jgi:hypothetical protein